MPSCFSPTIKPGPAGRALAAAAWLAAGAAQAGTLYDGSLGTKPGAQGWADFAPFPASESVSGGAVTLDTSFGNALQAGFSRSPTVDSAAGFTLSFTAQLLSESHSGNANRAGFSLIVLDGSHRGVELGFWTDQIWAQSLDNLNQFVKAESAAISTTALIHYSLSLHGGAYALSANGAPLLSGQMRDYSPSAVAVYALNNFLFLGDDTQSAKAVVKLAYVGQVPEPPPWALLAAGLAAAALLPRSRKGFGRGG